jgi:hypothetical protein
MLQGHVQQQQQNAQLNGRYLYATPQADGEGDDGGRGKAKAAQMS